MTNEVKTAEQRRVDMHGKFDAYLHNIIPFYEQEVAELRAKVESLAADAESAQIVLVKAKSALKCANYAIKGRENTNFIHNAIDAIDAFMAKEKA